MNKSRVTLVLEVLGWIKIRTYYVVFFYFGIRDLSKIHDFFLNFGIRGLSEVHVFNLGVEVCLRFMF